MIGGQGTEDVHADVASRDPQWPCAYDNTRNLLTILKLAYGSFLDFST